MIPSKLKKGDEVRIIAPALSHAIITQDVRNVIKKRFDDLGLELSFGKHAEEIDDFNSSSVDSRISDLHEAFKDSSVKAIFSVIGGSNCNQLLDHIDWDIIKNNPKILCGFSDITILNIAILKKTGLVTYSGPHYSTFGQEKYLDYTIEYFKKCLMNDGPISIKPSEKWSDDAWYLDQKKRVLEDNSGFYAIQNGEAEGTILGGNLCTLNLLQGTKYFPALKDSILFLEDDSLSTPQTFNRDLHSLTQQPGFDDVKGLMIGRFQKKSKMTNKLLVDILKTKSMLNNIPVVANVDFGHTDPKITFPIGGKVKISVTKNPSIEILTH